MNNITKYVIPAASSVLGGVVTFFGLQLEQDKITADYAERIKATEIRLEQAQATNARMSDILNKTAADLTEVRKAAQNAASPGLEALGSVDTITRRLESLERQLQEGGVTPSGEVQFTVIDREISELKQQLKRLGSRIAGQSAPVPTVEEIAAELARNYAETLRGPQGPAGLKGDQGPRGQTGYTGANGASPSVADIIAALPPQTISGATQTNAGATPQTVPTRIMANDCLDFQAFNPVRNVTFEDGSLLCNGQKPVAVVRFHSTSSVKIFPMGSARYTQVYGGESFPLTENGVFFFLTQINESERTVIGGVSSN